MAAVKLAGIFEHVHNLLAALGAGYYRFPNILGSVVPSADHPTWAGHAFSKLDCVEIDCTLDYMAIANEKWLTQPYSTYATRRWTTAAEFDAIFRQLRADHDAVLLPGHKVQLIKV